MNDLIQLAQSAAITLVKEAYPHRVPIAFNRAQAAHLLVLAYLRGREEAMQLCARFIKGMDV